MFISNAESNEAISEDHDANVTRLGQNPKDTEGYGLRSRNKQPIGHTSKGGCKPSVIPCSLAFHIFCL